MKDAKEGIFSPSFICPSLLCFPISILEKGSQSSERFSIFDEVGLTADPRVFRGEVKKALRRFRTSMSMNYAIGDRENRISAARSGNSGQTCNLATGLFQKLLVEFQNDKPKH